MLCSRISGGRYLRVPDNLFIGIWSTPVLSCLTANPKSAMQHWLLDLTSIFVDLISLCAIPGFRSLPVVTEECRYCNPSIRETERLNATDVFSDVLVSKYSRKLPFGWYSKIVQRLRELAKQKKE